MSYSSILKQYFTIHASKKGSSDLIYLNKYVNTGWTKHIRDSDHGLMRVGDIVIAYFTSHSIIYKMQLKHAYSVTKISENKNSLNLELCGILPGIGSKEIRSIVESGQLSDKLRNIGRQGFNITIISESDAEFLLENMVIPNEDYSSHLVDSISNKRDRYEEFEEISNNKLMHFYHDEYDEMSKKLKGRLVRAGLLHRKKEKGKSVLVPTQKGKDALQSAK
jgi:hypothetical protein